MKGFVSFVSAGPGDPELLTLKGAARLAAADVVLYDHVASSAILGHARPGTRLVSVGKRAGCPSPKQAHVSRLLVAYATTARASFGSSPAMPECSAASKRRLRR